MALLVRMVFKDFISTDKTLRGRGMRQIFTRKGQAQYPYKKALQARGTDAFPEKKKENNDPTTLPIALQLQLNSLFIPRQYGLNQV